MRRKRAEKTTMTTKNLLVELFVEELPPKALESLGKEFTRWLATSLAEQDLVDANSAPLPQTYVSPRRLAAWIPNVLSKADDALEDIKLMPVAVGFDPSGKPTPALTKKLAAFGGDIKDVIPMPSGLHLKRVKRGVGLTEGLQRALSLAIAKLPIPKVMTYQLESGCELPGWSSVSFVRPAHSLIALHGSEVVPVQALGLSASNTTQGHRFEAAISPVVVPDADAYAAVLAMDGAVIASFAERRAEIVRQLAAAAAKVGGGCKPIEDEALLDEVTALVERPNVLICEFEKQFLDVPQECLILTMKVNQKYFPLLDAANKLTNKFLVVSNITPDDASFVIGGNERVVRPRLADAKFFFDQDRKKTLESRLEGLGKVVYHNKLGTQGERMKRVVQIAARIVQLLAGGGEVDVDLIADVLPAAKLAKTDLLTDMVGEFPELQGIMGGYYALNDGLPEAVAQAIEDHYKPRFAGDDLPRNTVGLVVALADKLETLVGMFGIGNLPTGDKDPFALRRHALGVIRILVEKEKDLPISLVELLEGTLNTMNQHHDVPVRLVSCGENEFGGESFVGGGSRVNFNFTNQVASDVVNFIYDRLASSLREQGYSAQEVDAVLALRPQRMGDVPKRLLAVRAFAALPESSALAAANKRIGNILKKTDDVDAHVSELLLQEAAEKVLYATMQTVVPKANAQFTAGDYTASLQTLAALRAPVDAFFEHVMVNAEALDLRLNRLGLLKCLHDGMNRVADLSKLSA
jgi:glycyl-tRNA synthetase beta chain